MIARRIIPRGALGAAMHCDRSPSAKQQCRATIDLDATTYRCGRAEHSGIHDAFAVHSDEGEVRW